MQYKNSLLLIGLLAVGAVTAQEFDNNDVPRECRNVCQLMVDAARTCDNNFDGDREEVDCICSTNGASTQLPECAACIHQYTDDDDDENDVDEVVSSCGFASTTFNAASTGTNTGSGTITPSSSVSMITSVITTTSTDFDDDPDDRDETDTLTRTTVFPANVTAIDAPGSASNGGSAVTSSADSGMGAATSNAGNAASSATSAAGDAVTDSGAAATALPLFGAGALAAVLGLL